MKNAKVSNLLVLACVPFFHKVVGLSSLIRKHSLQVMVVHAYNSCYLGD
jgi:hypothetical protein